MRGRNSDNALILEKLGWEPTIRLADGLKVTYFWIKSELDEVRPFDILRALDALGICCSALAISSQQPSYLCAQ